MDYRSFLKEFDEKTPSQIREIAFDYCDTICSAVKKIDPNETMFSDKAIEHALYFGALAVSFADNIYDIKEIKMANDLLARFGLDLDVLTPQSAKELMKIHFADANDLVLRVYTLFAQLDENDLYNEYKEITNNQKLTELFIKFLCAIIAVNGDVDESEIDYLESLINCSESTSNTSSASSTDTQNLIDTSSDNDLPPKVVRLGGSLYNGEYNKYFSVGAEISIEGRDVSSLDIRVQLLDSDGFILETFDEKINWVERGIFYFGKEYRINCSPSNFKIIVGARERGDLNDDYKPSIVFKCTGFRFQRSGSSYSDNYDLACMVENVRPIDGNPEADVYTVFYDENNNIVGGAQLSGNVLYYGQPDRYESDIDCKTVIFKTKVFRWSCDLSFIM